MEGATRSAGGVWRVNKATVHFTSKYLPAYSAENFTVLSTSEYLLCILLYLSVVFNLCRPAVCRVNNLRQGAVRR